jgi:ParB-like chromosome segregation protein Spo0J
VWFDEGRLQELAESIRIHGILQPIRVRPDRRSHLPPGGFLITMGERRFLAAQQAGLVAVPAIIDDVDEEQALIGALTENLQRQDLTPDEENEAVRRLRERGMSDSDIARRLGVSKSTISRLVAVFDDPNLGPRVTDGRLTLTQARELLNLPRPDQARLADFLLERQRQGSPVGRTELRQLVIDVLRLERAANDSTGVDDRQGDIDTAGSGGEPLPASGGTATDRGHRPPPRFAAPRADETPEDTIRAIDLFMRATPPAPSPYLSFADLAPDSLSAARVERERQHALVRARALYASVMTELAILAPHLSDGPVREVLAELAHLVATARESNS